MRPVYEVEVKTEPAAEPVLKAEVKTNIRMDSGITDLDTRIDNLIVAVRKKAEEYTRLRFINTVVIDHYNGIPLSDKDCLAFSQYPLIATSAELDTEVIVKYTDNDGATQTWNIANYDVFIHGDPIQILPVFNGDYPTIRNHLDVIQVEYTAGYGTAATDVPGLIKEGIIAGVSFLLQHPELVTPTRGGITPNKMPDAFFDELTPFRREGF